MTTKSYWQQTAQLPQFEPISADVDVNVVVIGGGLTGITAAYLLKREGVTVALLERGRCAQFDTGHTTAHLTYVTDQRIRDLVKHFGKDAARAFWEGGAAAIDQIDAIVRETETDCEFRWAPAYLHAPVNGSPKKSEIDDLQEDAELARELGFDASFVVEVPNLRRAGVRFEHQAKFHPLKYLAPMLKTIQGNGSFVFEHSEAGEIEIDPLRVRCGGRTIRCEYLMIATHNPLLGTTGLLSGTLFQTKLALYTSYVLGARVARNTLPEALFWDTSDPYDYLRVDRHNDHDYLIFGGNDRKTGQEEDPNEIFAELQEKLSVLAPGAQVVDRWLGQVVETHDGMPFIGESDEGRQFIATGFCGNGFTLGTLSAMMMRDRYLKRRNPWFDLFAVNRKEFHGGTWRYVRENLDFPYYMLRDRLRGAEGNSIDEVLPGEGKILKLDGKKVAAFRDDHGNMTLCSPVCTHLKCIVHWNAADRTWDCPCHGSRFSPSGAVYAGPAEKPLEKLPLPVAHQPM